MGLENNAPKMYVMKWSDREGPYNHKDHHGLWVGIDTASGGYPVAYEQFGNAEIFTLYRAESYQQTFPCLDIYELTISITPVK